MGRVSLVLTVVALVALNFFICRRFPAYFSSNRGARLLFAILTGVILLSYLHMLNMDLKYLYLIPLASVTFSILLVDGTARIIPNSITLGLAISQTLFLSIGEFLGYSLNLVTGVLTSIALFTTFFIVNIFSRGKVGMGDVKLALGIGLATGAISLEVTTLTLLMMSVTSGLYATLLLLVKRATLHSEFAFGPFMLLGVWISMYGNALANQIG